MRAKVQAWQDASQASGVAQEAHDGVVVDVEAVGRRDLVLARWG